MATETCIIINNVTDFYARRNRATKKKYGDELGTHARFYTLCEEDRCVNPDHIVRVDTVFEEYGRKPCTSCGKWLPPNAYYDDKKSVNGKMAKCKVCAYKPK